MTTSRLKLGIILLLTQLVCLGTALAEEPKNDSVESVMRRSRTPGLDPSRVRLPPTPPAAPETGPLPVLFALVSTLSARAQEPKIGGPVAPAALSYSPLEVFQEESCARLGSRKLELCSGLIGLALLSLTHPGVGLGAYSELRYKIEDEGRKHVLTFFAGSKVSASLFVTKSTDNEVLSATFVLGTRIN